VKNRKPIIPVSKSFARYLKEARLNAGLTQTYVAEQLGVKNQLICNWERGASSPSFNFLPILIDLYGLSKIEVMEQLLKEHNRIYTEALKIRRK